MNQDPIPPGMMARSFLTVASSLVLVVIASIVCMFGIGLAFFPQFAKFFNEGPEALKAVMETNPTAAIPPLMFWSAVFATAIICLVIGWYVIKTAPFAHFPHAIFVAVLLFIYYLQMAIGDPEGKKSMTLIYMFVYPLAILVGAKMSINRLVQQHASEDSQLLDESSAN